MYITFEHLNHFKLGPVAPRQQCPQGTEPLIIIMLSPTHYLPFHLMVSKYIIQQTGIISWEKNQVLIIRKYEKYYDIYICLVPID